MEFNPIAIDTSIVKKVHFYQTIVLIKYAYHKNRQRDDSQRLHSPL